MSHSTARRIGTRGRHARREERSAVPGSVGGLRDVIAAQDHAPTAATILRSSAQAGGSGAVAAGALGVCLGLAMTAAAVRLASDFDGGLRPAAAGLLLALATGLAAPGTLAAWLVGRARGMGIGGLSRGGLRSNPHIQSGVMAAAALIGGLTTATLPFLCARAADAYRFMHVHFLWHTPSEIALQLTLGFCCGLAPIGLLGMALVRVQSWSPGSEDAVPSAPGAALIGGGAGVLAAWALAAQLGRPEAAMMAAALPALALAVVAVWRMPPSIAVGHVAESVSDVRLPTVSDRRPRMLRAGIVVAGACAAWTLAGWIAEAGTPQRVTAVACGVLLAGLGWCVAGWRRPEKVRDLADFGLCCAGAGGIVAVAVLMHERGGAIGLAGSALMGLGLAGVGLACATGQVMALHRTAVRPSTWGRLYARLVVGGLVAAGAGVPLSRWVIGPLATSAAGALALLILGAALIFREPHQSAATRRRRLALVFGLLAATTLLVPA